MVWIDFDTNQKLQKNHPNLTQLDNRGEFQRNTRIKTIYKQTYMKFYLNIIEANV